MVALPKQAGADNFEEHGYLSLLATLSKWMMRVFVERMRQHPRSGVHRRVHKIGFTQGWQTSAVIGTVKEVFWHARRWRCNVVMVSMDIHQCLDHMDARGVVAAVQARQSPRWLVRGVARELCLLKATARIPDGSGPWNLTAARAENGVVLSHQLYSTSSSSTISLPLLSSGTRIGQVTGGGEDDREMEKLSYRISVGRTTCGSSHPTLPHSRQ